MNIQLSLTDVANLMGYALLNDGCLNSSSTTENSLTSNHVHMSYSSRHRVWFIVDNFGSIKVQFFFA